MKTHEENRVQTRFLTLFGCEQIRLSFRLPKNDTTMSTLDTVKAQVDADLAASFEPGAEVVCVDITSKKRYITAVFTIRGTFL